MSKLDNWEYNEEEDTWTCAAGRKQWFRYESSTKDIKKQSGFRRFLIRGLRKVSLEVGWLSLAYNLLKKAVIDRKRERAVQG
ncbi:transposase [Paenibacillus pabuli]